MAGSTRPRYVSRWDIGGSPQPFAATGILGYHFFLHAKLANLEQLCDRYLNEPSQGRLHYVPVLPYVILEFIHTRQLSCLAPTYRRIGWSSEMNAAFLVLTASLKRNTARPEVD